MNTLKNDDAIKDKEDSRAGLERRQFSYTSYIPEKRSGKDRRRIINRIRRYDRRCKQTKNDLK